MRLAVRRNVTIQAGDTQFAIAVSLKGAPQKELHRIIQKIVFKPANEATDFFVIFEC